MSLKTQNNAFLNFLDIVRVRKGIESVFGGVEIIISHRWQSECQENTKWPLNIQTHLRLWIGLPD